jgi:hypothetical protein
MIVGAGRGFGLVSFHMALILERRAAEKTALMLTELTILKARSL